MEDGGYGDLVARETVKRGYKRADEYQSSTGKIEFYSVKAEEVGGWIRYLGNSR